MAGVDSEYDGEATPMPNLRIGFLPQEPRLDPTKTVRETVEEGMGEVLAAKAKLEEIYAAYAEPDADFDTLAAEQAKYEGIITASGADSDVQMEIAADALRLPPWDAKIEKLSGGEKRRVALCRLLLSKPDMLLLDERTNHLYSESVEGLEQFLAGTEGTTPGSRGQAGIRPHQGDAEGTGVGAFQPQGAPGQEQGAHCAIRGVVVPRAPEAER